MSLKLGRIWSRIIRVKDGCWIWPGNKNPRGYGVVCINKKQYLAHRVAWSNFHDRDPGEQIVMHDCDNPSCVNPEHLILGDRIKNNADMRARGRGCNPPLHVGEKHPQARLTEEQAREVFQRRDNGEPLKVLSEEFNISESVVCAIHNGRSWTSVTTDLTRRRELKPIRKLTPDIVKRIFLRRKNGESPGILSSEYNVNLATISKIYNRHRHREITEGLN